MTDQRRGMRNDRGAAVVEMAFMTLLLFFLVAGAVDLGRALFTQIAVQDAAQEGTLYGSHRPESEDLIVTRVREATGYPELNAGNVDVSCPNGSPSGGDVIAVTVTYDLDLITPIIGNLFGGSLELSRQYTGQVFNGECLTP